MRSLFPITCNLFPMTSLLESVRKHTENLRDVGGIQLRRLAQPALALAGFGRQDVTSKRMMTHNFTAAGNLEPFGGALMGLEFQFNFLSLSQSNLLKIPVVPRAWPKPAPARGL
jgi:hypothetical protein